MQSPLIQQYQELQHGEVLDVSFMDEEEVGEVVPSPGYVMQVPRGFPMRIDLIISSNIDNYIKAIEIIWGSDALNNPTIQEAIQATRELIDYNAERGYIPKPKPKRIQVPNFIKNMISQSENLDQSSPQYHRSQIPIPIRIPLPLPKSQLPLPKSQLPLSKSQLPLPKSQLPLPKSQSQKLPIPSQKLPIPSQKLPIPSPKLPIPSPKLPIPSPKSQSQKLSIPSPKMPLPAGKLTSSTINKHDEDYQDINYIENLPHDTIIKIALDLNFDKINDLCTLTTIFNNVICNNNEFWRRKYSVDFSEIQGPKGTKNNWREVYKNTMRKLNIWNFIIDNFGKYEFNKIEDYQLKKYYNSVKNYEEFITLQWNYLSNSSDDKLNLYELSIRLINNEEIAVSSDEHIKQQTATVFLINNNNQIVYLNTIF